MKKVNHLPGNKAIVTLTPCKKKADCVNNWDNEHSWSTKHWKYV